MEFINKLKLYYRIIDYGNAMWEHDEETAGDVLAELEWALKYKEEKNGAQRNYAYSTMEEYESIVGFKVNDAFKMGWDMARTTNEMLGIINTREEKNETLY